VEGIRRFKTDKAFAKKIIAKYLRIADDKKKPISFFLSFLKESLTLSVKASLVWPKS
jgi:hypothetical protein